MPDPSFSQGDAFPSLKHETVGERLRAVASRFAGREALVSRRQNLRATYAELYEQTGRVARALMAAGVQPGDRVGIWSPNCLEWVLVQLAAARVGAILVCINPGYDEDEGEYALSLSGTNVLFARASFQGTQFPALVKEMRGRLPELRRVVVHGREPRFERVLPNGWLEFLDGADAVSEAALLGRERLVRPEDPHHIQFTSGTTGRPKGVVLSHDNILNNADMIAHTMRYDERDRACLGSQLYHTMGNTFGVLACVGQGAALVLPGDAFDARVSVAALVEERCTSFVGTPSMYIAMLQALSEGGFGSADLSSMRTGIMAGAPCPLEVMKQVTTTMHIPEITICYGMTETSPVSCQTRIDDALEKRVGTVGRAHPHVEIKIVDPRTNEIVERGQPGEFCARGYHVMLGYWRNEEATRRAIQDGWIHTGDVAVMDGDGYVRVKGRIKDTITKAGATIYPRDIEEVLFRHPAVADVQVIGVADPRCGQEVMAWVKLKPGLAATEAELASLCAASLPPSLVPPRWRFVDGFPANMAGKVMKYVLREIVAREDEAREPSGPVRSAAVAS